MRTTGRLACGRTCCMTDRYRFLTAQGLARALLAGDMRRDGLLARGAVALGGSVPSWLSDLLDQLPLLSETTWSRLTCADLAARIDITPAFNAAWIAGPPTIRRWILRPSHRHPAPWGLDHLTLPPLDHHRAVADWLGIGPEDLDWFTTHPELRRRRPLHRQHHAFRLIPKAGGGGRLLEVPRPRLKALQTRVLRDILDTVPVHEACHGFVAGRSVSSHAALHAGQAVVLQFDLKDFFHGIGIAKVRAVFATLGFPPGVAHTLAALCTVLTPEPVIERLRGDGWIDWQQARRLRSPHLAQGAPSSPMLANLCAFQLDLRLDGLAWVLGARYSRYADDLVFSGPASLAAAFPRITAWVGMIAQEEGYLLNPRKTRLATQAAAQQVCGVVVNAHPNLKRAEFDRLRAVLHQCALHGPASQNREGHADFRAHLLGRVAWAVQLNPGRAARLQALWRRIDWA